MTILTWVLIIFLLFFLVLPVCLSPNKNLPVLKGEGSPAPPGQRLGGWRVGTVWGCGLTSASLGGDEAPSGEVVSKVTGESWGTGLSPSGTWGTWRDWGVDQALDVQRWGGQRAGAALCSPLLSHGAHPQLSGRLRTAVSVLTRIRARFFGTSVLWLSRWPNGNGGLGDSVSLG